MAAKSSLDEKKIFLVLSADRRRQEWFTEVLTRHLTHPTVFTAEDGITGLAKFQNVPPHVLISDIDLPKMSGLKLVELGLAARKAEATAFVLIGPPPDEEWHLDELVTGRVQFCPGENNEDEFSACIMRSLNYSAHHENTEFRLRFLAKGDVLLKEGEKADNVYFVKKGRLQASKKTPDSEVVLGTIDFGEFVGEMAYINGEARAAFVTALTDCELIEVPMGRFEKVLFRRPSWSKALMMTLSKRLKKANEGKLRE